LFLFAIADSKLDEFTTQNNKTPRATTDPINSPKPTIKKIYSG
jgi:hypothetical protein